MNDSLMLERGEMREVGELLSVLRDSALSRNDSVLVVWVNGLKDLVLEQELLRARADSIRNWYSDYSEKLGSWHQAMQLGASYDSFLIRMDDKYTQFELESQRRNCVTLLAEISRWRKDCKAFNRLFDTLSLRSHVILSNHVFVP
jgi:hypothetical protein